MAGYLQLQLQPSPTSHTYIHIRVCIPKTHHCHYRWLVGSGHWFTARWRRVREVGGWHIWKMSLPHVVTNHQLGRCTYVCTYLLTCVSTTTVVAHAVREGKDEGFNSALSFILKTLERSWEVGLSVMIPEVTSHLRYYDLEPYASILEFQAKQCQKKSIDLYFRVIMEMVLHWMSFSRCFRAQRRFVHGVQMILLSKALFCVKLSIYVFCRFVLIRTKNLHALHT